MSECMGQCICCRDGREETTEHMCTCAGREAALAATLRRVDAVWKEARMANEWHTCDWVRRPEEGGIEYPGWKNWWGHMGLAPREGVRELGRLTTKAKLVDKLAKKTAVILLESTYKRWECRNTAVLEAERLNGVHEAKTYAGRRGGRWESASTGKARGRPPKAWEDLSLTQQRARQSKAHKQRAVLELGEEQGKEAHKQWLRERRHTEKGGAHRRHTQLTLKEWARGVPSELPDCWRKAAHRGTLGMTTVWAQSGTTGKVAKPQGTCTYGACMKAGTRPAWGCLVGEALRCETCAALGCWGQSECQCKASLLNAPQRKSGGRSQQGRKAREEEEKLRRLEKQVALWRQGGRAAYI